jgi:hypothetical protein
MCSHSGSTNTYTYLYGPQRGEESTGDFCPLLQLCPAEVEIALLL